MPKLMRNCAQQCCQQIAFQPALTPETKRHFHAEAERSCSYPLAGRCPQAPDEGVICDMFEGHALQTAPRAARLRPISG